jgi:hypothetical protein
LHLIVAAILVGLTGCASDLKLKESEPYMPIVDGAEVKPTKGDD